jgi:flagellar hook assembly protein FlgD
MSAGHHRFTWDGRGHNGHHVASGIYLVRVRAGMDEVRRRLILLR